VDVVVVEVVLVCLLQPHQ